MSLKIVFAGTPVFASQILQDLLKASQTIQAVYTQPDRPAGRGRKLQSSAVKQLALHHQLPIYQPVSLKDPKEEEKLKDLAPDLMIVAAYGLILPPTILNIPKFGCWNVHASLLPHWRGASPIQQAILHGDSVTGITLMQMDAGLDTGDIINCHPLTIELRETSESLQQRLAGIAGPALIATLKELETGKKIMTQKQNSANVSYAPKITKEAAKVAWDKPAIEIDRQIRAFNPWPVAFTELSQQRLKIYAAEPLPNLEEEGPPGTIMTVTQTGIDVATGDGILRLLELQFPGGKRQNIASILNSKKTLFQPGFKFTVE